MEAIHALCGFHICRCNQMNPWENHGMSKDVDMGIAGSFTMILLVSATALLLRSFYKRYTRVQNREDETNS
jgi:hypothetical protein